LSPHTPQIQLDVKHLRTVGSTCSDSVTNEIFRKNRDFQTKNPENKMGTTGDVSTKTIIFSFITQNGVIKVNQ